MSELEIVFLVAIAFMAVVTVWLFWYAIRSDRHNREMRKAAEAKDAQLTAAKAEVAKLTRERDAANAEVAKLTRERNEAYQKAGSLCGELVTARCRNGALEDEIERITRETAALTEERDALLASSGVLGELHGVTVEMLLDTGRAGLNQGDVRAAIVWVRELAADFKVMGSPERLSTPDQEGGIETHFPVLYRLLRLIERLRQERDAMEARFTALAEPGTVVELERVVRALLIESGRITRYEAAIVPVVQLAQLVGQLANDLSVTPQVEEPDLPQVRQGAHRDAGVALLALTAAAIHSRQPVQDTSKASPEELTRLLIDCTRANEALEARLRDMGGRNERFVDALKLVMLATGVLGPQDAIDEAGLKYAPELILGKLGKLGERIEQLMRYDAEVRLTVEFMIVLIDMCGMDAEYVKGVLSSEDGPKRLAVFFGELYVLVTGLTRRIGIAWVSKHAEVAHVDASHLLTVCPDLNEATPPSIPALSAKHSDHPGEPLGSADPDATDVAGRPVDVNGVPTRIPPPAPGTLVSGVVPRDPDNPASQTLSGVGGEEPGVTEAKKAIEDFKKSGGANPRAPFMQAFGEVRSGADASTPGSRTTLMLGTVPDTAQSVQDPRLCATVPARPDDGAGSCAPPASKHAACTEWNLVCHDRSLDSVDNTCKVLSGSTCGKQPADKIEAVGDSGDSWPRLDELPGDTD